MAACTEGCLLEKLKEDNGFDECIVCTEDEPSWSCAYVLNCKCSKVRYKLHMKCLAFWEKKCVMCNEKIKINDVVEIREPFMLHLAVEENALNTVEHILNYHKNYGMNVLNCEGKTPLHLAIIGNNIEMVQLLLKYGVSLFVETGKGVSPLQLSVSLPVEEGREYPKIYELLFENFYCYHHVEAILKKKN